MAALAPFRALRPASNAARVAAVPYDVVGAEEARAAAAGNPLSFLHVSRAEIDLPPGTDPHAPIVYDTAVANFRALRAAAPLVVEESPAVYVYRLRRDRHEQAGVAGCFSLDEYERDVIRKHEHTRRDKEDDRTRHTLALRAQTGPVFLVYRAVQAIDALVARIAATQAPMADFVADDGVAHTVWRAAPGDAHDLVALFAAIPTLYIADGHHRAASAARARRELAGPDGRPGEWDTFLAVAFPHDQVRILPYNRVVADLGGLTAAAFLAQLRGRFTIAEGPPVPRHTGEVAMLLDGRWYAVALGGPPAQASPAERLDVSRLQDALLAPLLGIGDIRSDKRIEFVGGAGGPAQLERIVAAGRAAVAFSMHPVAIGDLMTITDAGGIMPPKSTWFEPKLRDGLLSHLI